MKDKTLTSLYSTKGYNDTAGANFDLYEASRGFSFSEYCEKAWADVETEACLVITGKQFIVTYTQDFGRGPHNGTYARIMKEISQAGGTISSFKESISLCTKLHLNYLYARIDYHVNTDYSNKRTGGSGVIAFMLINTTTGRNKVISENQYYQFLEFYKAYNEDIKYACSKYGLKVFYNYYDKDGKKIKVETDSLDSLLKFISENYSKELVNDDDELIFDNTKTKK